MFTFGAEALDRHLSNAAYRGLCDIVYRSWEAPDSERRDDLADGAVVYCKRDFVNDLVTDLRRRRARVVLITGESDYETPGRRAWWMPSQLSHWFGFNVTRSHRRVTALPLGLTPRWYAGGVQVELLKTRQVDPARRPRLLYVNHRVETNPGERARPYELFKSRRGDWVTIREPGPSAEAYLDEMLEHRFMCCPPGNGIDTHRLWEALYSRTIPVVKRSAAIEHFSDLPMVIVDDYDEVTEARLWNEWERLSSKSWPCERMFVDHWATAIRRARDAVLSRE